MLPGRVRVWSGARVGSPSRDRHGGSDTVFTVAPGALPGHYTANTLPLGVVRGLADTLHGDGTGLGRAGAIVAGLATVTAGYGIGVLRGITQRQR
jgi:hypothetical protein